MARTPCDHSHDPNGRDPRDPTRPLRCACGYVGGLDVLPVSDRVPKTSHLVEQVVGTLENGGRVRVSLWDAFTSHGYKTNYQHVRTRILEVAWSWREHSYSSSRQVYRFTGRNFDQAESAYRQNARLVRTEVAA